MARRYKYCSRCRKTITDAEIARGLFVETDRGLFCATCAQLLDEAAPPEPAAETKPQAEQKPTPGPAQEASRASGPSTEHSARILADIRRKLDVIHRSIMFEKTSYWNVIAAVAQVVAVGALVMAALRWLEGPQDLLLVALIFQLLALTFFVKGK